MTDFWAMGGYAVYVWPAYGISFVVLAGVTWMTLRAHARARRRLSELEGMKP
jgi:heme exporter protein D